VNEIFINKHKDSGAPDSLERYLHRSSSASYYLIVIVLNECLTFVL